MESEAPFRVLFAAAFVLNLGIVGRFRARAQAGRRFDYSREGWPLFLLLRISGLAVLAYCLLYVVAPGLIARSLVTEPAPLRFAGATLALGPVPAFIAWAQRSIGDNVSPTVTTREGQKLVTKGTYAWIRNPLYVGGFALLGSLSLVAGSAFLAVAAFIALALVSLRLPKEEAELDARFGDEWRAYRARTGRYLPRLVRRSGSYTGQVVPPDRGERTH